MITFALKLNKMIVGVIARLLLTDKLEGIPRYIYETTRVMALQNPNDRFILYFDRKPVHLFDFPNNITTRTIPLPTRHPLLWIIWFEFLLPIFLRKDKVDVLYCPDGFLSLISQKPVVLVTHDLAYIHYPDHLPTCARYYYSFFIKKFHQKANHIIAVSKATQNDIITQFGIPKNKISVAYNALQPFKNAEQIVISKKINSILEDGRPYFCFIGALHPRKNITTLCDAFILYKNKYDSNIKLVIAGRYAWKSQNIKTKMESDPDIVFVGQITESEKYILLKKSLALIYISLFEGFGIPLIEAMQAKTMVITSNLSSMPEIVGNAGILVNPLDIDEISEAMNTSTDMETRNLMIQAGTERLQFFSWEKSATIIYESLSQIKKLKN